MLPCPASAPDTTRALLCIFLVWQALVYGSALRTSIWAYQQATPSHRAQVPRTIELANGFDALRHRAVWIAAGLALLASMFLVSLNGAPGLQRMLHLLSPQALVAASELLVCARLQLLHNIVGGGTHGPHWRAHSRGWRPRYGGQRAERLVDEADEPRAIDLDRSDRWTLAHVNGRWLVELEVNRADKASIRP